MISAILGALIGVAICGGGMYAIERTHPEDMARRVLEPEEMLALAREENPDQHLLDELDNMANDLDSEIMPSDLVSLAGTNAESSALVSEAIRNEEEPPIETLGVHLSNEDVHELARERGAYPDPIDSVVRMDDDPRTVYAWILEDTATEDDRASLGNELEETFVRANRSEPQSLHLIVRDVEEIRELDAETVKNFIKPWLKGTQEGSGGSGTGDAAAEQSENEENK